MFGGRHSMSLALSGWEDERNSEYGSSNGAVGAKSANMLPQPEVVEATSTIKPKSDPNIQEKILGRGQSLDYEATPSKLPAPIPEPQRVAPGPATKVTVQEVIPEPHRVKEPHHVSFGKVPNVQEKQQSIVAAERKTVTPAPKPLEKKLSADEEDYEEYSLKRGSSLALSEALSSSNKQPANPKPVAPANSNPAAPAIKDDSEPNRSIYGGGAGSLALSSHGMKQAEKAQKEEEEGEEEEHQLKRGSSLALSEALSRNSTSSKNTESIFVGGDSRALSSSLGRQNNKSSNGEEDTEESETLRRGSSLVLSEAMSRTSVSSRQAPRSEYREVDIEAPSFADNVTVREVIQRIGREHGWSEEEMESDAKAFTKNRLKTVKDLRSLTLVAWKELDNILPVTKDLVRQAIGGAL